MKAFKSNQSLSGGLRTSASTHLTKRFNSVCPNNGGNEKTLIISQRSQLQSLIDSRHEHIIFDGLPNMRMPEWSREPKFPPLARNIVFHGCDKNFVFFATNHWLGCNAENYYLNSHPCEPYLLQVLNNVYKRVYLTPPFHRYKQKWAADLPRVQTISQEIYNELIKSYGYKNVW